MNQGEFKKLVAALPAENDHFPVWIGVDAGEGWIPFNTVFTTNARHCSLDGDEVETESIYPEDQAEINRIDFSLYTQDPFSTDSYYRDILVIGDYNSEGEVENRKQFEIKKLQKIENEKKIKEQREIEEARQKEQKKLMEADPDYKQLKELEQKIKNKYK